MQDLCHTDPTQRKMWRRSRAIKIASGERHVDRADLIADMLV